MPPAHPDRVTTVGRRGVETVRDLLGRNDVPHSWVDLDRDPLGRLLDSRALSGRRLPLVLFPDGTELEGREDSLELLPGRIKREWADQCLASARRRGRRAGGPHCRRLCSL